jgi:hypothetical protein
MEDQAMTDQQETAEERGQMIRLRCLDLAVAHATRNLKFFDAPPDSEGTEVVKIALAFEDFVMGGTKR